MANQAGRGLLLVALLVLAGTMAKAAPFAAYVIDARDGQVLYEENANTRLHPASLTKMMTLYLVFDAVEHGRLSLDQKITISRNAASEPPSKLGMRPGQKLELRYLIRAAAVKSANDAATALGEAVAGSEEAFARKMTATARAMGMRNTTFKNANGLTREGHLSTAHDMAILGRRLFFDFPEYYNLFSRRSTSAKIKTVYNTNRRLLAAYRGADGIKTGYTRASGFNLVASAKRGQERVIVAVFGGTSTAARNKKVAELMDLGFRKMPSHKAVHRPAPITVPSGETLMVASVDTRLKTAPRPFARPVPAAAVAAAEVAEAVTRAAADGDMPQLTATKQVPVEAMGAADATPAVVEATVEAAPAAPARGSLVPVAPRPMLRAGDPVPVAAVAPGEAQEVRSDNSGSYVVELGGTHNRSNAERLLLTTALQEMEALEGSRRDLQPAGSPGWYRARFVGLSQEAAEAACARLAARQTPCEVHSGG